MTQHRKLISIVTAAYNMEGYVGQTIRSVTDHMTPDCEYVFIDGASTDSTFAIAQSFKGKIDVLVSEPDDGQYHAIAKGFDLSSGEIMGWINADDVLMPWTLSVVAEIFRKFPEVEWITGVPSFLNDAGQLVRIQGELPAYPRAFIANGWYQKTLGAYLQQESMFWRRSLWDRAGGLDTGYSLAADFELWTRFAKSADLVAVDTPLAAFRERPGVQRSSSGAVKYEAEVAEVCAGKRKPPALWRMISGLGLVPRSLARLFIRHRGTVIRYDRNRSTWVKIDRSRALSRVSVPTMIDEWLMKRAPAGTTGASVPQ